MACRRSANQIKRMAILSIFMIIDLRKICQQYEKHGLKYCFNLYSHQERYFKNRYTWQVFLVQCLK